MPDVSRLVGIDAGVFDEYLILFFSLCSTPEKHLPDDLAAIQASVDVSSSGNLKCLEPRNRSQTCDNLFGSLPRRLAQTFGKIKRQRQRVLSQADLGRLLDYDVRK